MRIAVTTPSAMFGLYGQGSRAGRTASAGIERPLMISALLTLRRVWAALHYAVREIFTILYQILGIGILVEILRRLGLAFVAVQARER